MFLQINTDDLLKALDISWKSMLALFVAMFLLYLSIVLLSKIKTKDNK